MSWTFTISGSAIAKSGDGHNSIFDSASGATILTKWSDQAEGYIVKRTRKSFLSQYASLDTPTQSMLDEATSSFIGNKIIAYDMSGYTSRAEAQTMLDVNNDIVESCITVLTDFKNITLQDAV